MPVAGIFTPFTVTLARSSLRNRLTKVPNLKPLRLYKATCRTGAHNALQLLTIIITKHMDGLVAARCQENEFLQKSFEFSGEVG